MASYRYAGTAEVKRPGPFRFKLPLTTGGFQVLQVAAVGAEITVTDPKARGFVENLRDLAGNTLFTKVS
jgi:hypothetical protein